MPPHPTSIAAADYARRGFLVIPLYGVFDPGQNGKYICNCFKGADCPSPGKHPPFKHIFATRDPDFAARRHELVRKWNVGAILDDVVRVTVFDFDGAAGLDTRMKLEEAHGPLPETWRQATGRIGGGEHWFYRVPDHLNYYALRNRKVAPGLDIKADSGLVVLAPSQHHSGLHYRFVDDAPLAELPEWLYKVATSAKERVKVIAPSMIRPAEDELVRDGYPLHLRKKLARKAIMEAAPAVQGQNGSLACLRAAALLIRGYCLSSEDTFDMLWDLYNPRCVPPWAEGELMHKITHAEYEVSVETYPWRYRVPAPDLSPAGRMVDALFNEERNNVQLANEMATARQVTQFPDDKKQRRERQKASKKTYKALQAKKSG